jgi:long-subunit fatty acid transport protein
VLCSKGPMPPRPTARFVPLPARVAGGAWLACLLLLASAVSAQTETDRIDITGRQNLTLGSGARAYGMGGAFLARADDATAASWNPAGLSYLRVPELSLVGVSNSFDVTRGLSSDRFEGQAIDFAAFTWPIGFGDVRGAVQLSYQRAISFDGSRRIEQYLPTGLLERFEDGSSDGGFDVVAVGTGLRLSRRIRAGFTVNRWLNGYGQNLSRTILSDNQHPLREFGLDFRPSGWSFNLGLIVSPFEQLNVAAVYKTPFTADVSLDKSRRDSWGTISSIEEVTTNAASSEAVRLDFPSSFGFGLSWRPRDALTLSADFTRTHWSEARILNYFDLFATQPSDDGVPAVPPPPVVYPDRQYPTLRPVPDPSDPDDPLKLQGQQDAEQLRVGVEWVLIRGRLKVPLRAGYFNDRQIAPVLGGIPPRFNGFTAGTGLILGSMLFDVAWVYEFGEFSVAAEATTGGEPDVPPTPQPPLRYAVTTNRFYASVIYRFSGRWRP